MYIYPYKAIVFIIFFNFIMENFKRIQMKENNIITLHLPITQPQQLSTHDQYYRILTPSSIILKQIPDILFQD